MSTCKRCGKPTRSKIRVCSLCDQNTDEHGISSVKLRTWDEDLLEQHKLRIESYMAKVDIEEENMRDRGLDPNNHTYEGLTSRQALKRFIESGDT